MIECVVDATAGLGECPVWSITEQVLYWVDIDGHRIHRYDPASGVDDEREVPGRPGSLALTERPGRLLVALEGRLVWFDWEGGGVADWVELEPGDSGNRLNDGRCDPAGRFWVGSMHVPTSARRFTGMLHRVELDGSATTIRGQVGVSNGLAFSADGTTMYWADTLRDTVWAYDYDADEGRPSAERVFIDFSEFPGFPDGACVDAEGNYWVACVHGGAVMQFSPDGSPVRRIELPATRPTMPAFGGIGLDVLYVTSIGPRPADEGTPDAAGCLFAVETGARGLPEPVFGATGPDGTFQGRGL